MENDKKLLREFVREILKEDDTGGGYGSGDMSGMMNSWGGGMMNYGPSIKSWVIDPFLDVGKIFKASATKLATRVKTLFKIVLETVLTTVIPFLQSNYTLIFKQEKEELKRIREKYAEAFAAVDKVYTDDVMILSFMISPTAFITAKAAAKAPLAVMSMLEIFAHGNENMTKYFEDVRKRLDAIQKDILIDPDEYKIDKRGQVVGANSRGPYMTKAKRDLMKKTGINDALEFDDEVMFETPQAQSPADQAATLMQQVIHDPNVQKMIAQSPLAKQMQRDAYQIANTISSRILKEAHLVMSIHSIEDLQRIVKKPIGIEKLDTLQPEEKQQAEQALVQQTKAAMKQFYVKTLEGEINNTLQRGVDPNNLYIVTLRNTMSKISSLN